MSRRTWLPLAVAVGLLAAVGVQTVGAERMGSATAAVRSGVVVTDLRTEFAHNPLGVDVQRPRLSWVLTSPERAQRQTAYQVVVTWRSGGRQHEWDSGKVASAQSINVPYAGPQLRPSTRYHWRVRVRDAAGEASPWSPTAWWETGLLHQSNWQADWIGLHRGADDETPPDLEGSYWIWYPEGDPGTSAPPGTRYLRRTVSIPEGKQVSSARLLMTVDDSWIGYLNGQEIARSTSTWQQAITVDVTDQLRPGDNVIAVAGTNNGESAASALGVFEVRYADGTSLIVRTDEQWKVADTETAGWTDAGFDDSTWPAALEVAPYGEGVWTCCGGVNTSLPPKTADPLLRKELVITKPIDQARAYVVGLGYHELRVNGAKVGNSVLEGDVNDYTKRVGYSTYDVTRQLRRGGNAIGVMLGRGFFSVHQTTPLDWHRAPWKDEPKLLLQLEIRYDDGSTQTVVSDNSWRATDGPITYDSVFGGEDYDAQLAQPGWDTPAYDDASWPAVDVVDAPGGRLVAINNDPVRVVDTIRPVDVAEPKDGVYVLDVGHTLTGWGRLRTSGPAGTTVTLQYGQRLLSDGTVDFANGWHGGRSQTDQYTLRGDGVETWEPRFTFKSFRYIQVTGLPEPPAPDTVVAQSLHSDVDSVGRFESSNPLYNTFHDGMRRTILGNLLGYPAIDPYFEKSGWTEDVFVATQSMVDNFDLARLLEAWLEDIRDSQLPSGQIPIIIPSPGWGYDSWGTPSPIWTAVYPIMAWRLYENYGDRRLLAEHYPSITKYIDRELSRLDDGIVANEFLGDWVAPGYGVPPEDPRLPSTAYIYRQLTIVADMAEVLGHDADATAYREAAQHVKQRFNETFLDRADAAYETSTDPDYRQTSNLLPLAFGMVPDDMVRPVVDRLVADIESRDNHLNTGTLGTEVLLPVLTEYGHADVAHAIANQRTYPSWGYWYANGADTMWESWELTSRSRSHFFMGTVEQWLFEDVAGIGGDAPGHRRSVIRPVPAGGLSSARGSFESGYGEVASSWRIHSDAFRLDVTVPVNTTALVYVPTDDADSVTEGGRRAADSDGVSFVRVEDGYAVYEVGSGKYRFAASFVGSS